MFMNVTYNAWIGCFENVVKLILLFCWIYINYIIIPIRYNQLTYNNNRSEHCYEVGHFVVKNLLPNEPYREALSPHEVHLRRHLDKSVMLRIYTCVAPAVAGIMVKEHFEINVCPIAVRLTYKLVCFFFYFSISIYF